MANEVATQQLSALFNKKDSNDITNVRDIRWRMVDDLIGDDGDVPSGFEADRLAAMLTDIEESVFKRASLEIRASSGQAAEVNNALLAEMLNRIGDGQVTIPNAEIVEDEVDDAYLTLPTEHERELLPGEGRIGAQDKSLYQEIFGGATDPD